MSPAGRAHVFLGDALARYNFGAEHPFGPRRYGAFVDEFTRRNLGARVTVREPAMTDQAHLEWFHQPAYIEKVKAQSISGEGFLDCGDTPAFRGMFEVTSTIVGTALEALDSIMQGRCRRAFIPIAGLHHARRDIAAGFCVFNDCGVLIESLRRAYGVRKVAYVDIDAHHGDGVFYSFEDDSDLCFVDFHEDGNYLYPGTGFADETGQGEAAGTKLNIPMPPGAGDSLFEKLWPQAESFLTAARPEFIILQCGADSLQGDPITHLAYSAATHARVAERLVSIAERFADGRLLVLGGGGYNLENIAQAWCDVVEMLADGH